MNEAEMENIRGAQKRAKEPPARVARIQDRNAAHKKHQERLEQVLRALDNEALSVDQVDQLKETIEDYLARSQPYQCSPRLIHDTLLMYYRFSRHPALLYRKMGILAMRKAGACMKMLMRFMMRRS